MNPALNLLLAISYLLRSKRKTQPVIRQLDVRRKPLVRRFVLEVVGHVRQIRLGRLQTLNHVKGLIQAEMGRVRLQPQRVQDQDLEPLQKSHALSGNLADIGAIRQITYAKAEYIEVGVFERNRRD